MEAMEEMVQLEVLVGIMLVGEEDQDILTAK